MTVSWKLEVQNAVKVLQQWYTGPTGLYSWDGSDDEVMAEAGIPDSGFDVGSAHFRVAQVIQLVGLWDALRDTLRWWDTANAITAVIDYMLVTGDRSYLENPVDNTFNDGPNTWRPKPGITTLDWVGAATHAAVQFVANQANPSLPPPPLGPGGHAFPGWADPGAVFIGDIKVSNTNFIDQYYDDNAWWALAWIRAYDLTGDKKYLTQAETIFNDMKGGWDGVCDGGIYWQKNKQSLDGKTPYKNAIANELFICVAASLSRRLPDSGSHLDTANSAWNWFSSKYINNTFLINDALGLQGNTWSCTNLQTKPVWTYNHGVILGALCELYAASQLTNDSSPQLLDKAVNIADALLRQPVFKGDDKREGISGVKDGILTEYTDVSTSPVDNSLFKGIFMRNLGYLYKFRPLARYRSFIVNNAQSALNHARNGSDQFGGNWSGPFDKADFVRQTAAVDLLNAANVIPPQTDYTSLKQFLVDSRISLPARLRSVLNGAGSLKSVLHT